MAIRGRSQPYRPPRSLAYQWYVALTVATADVAVGTGTALTPGTEVIANAGIALGSGGTFDPSVEVVASVPTTGGAGTALTPSAIVVITTDIATGLGIALNPDVLGANGVARAGAATGIGHALDPSVEIVTPDGSSGDGFPWVTANAGIALGSGTAIDPVFADHRVALAGIATGSGQSLDPSVQIDVRPVVAFGIGRAFAAIFVTASTATSPALAQPLMVIVMQDGINEALLAHNGLTLVEILPG